MNIISRSIYYNRDDRKNLSNATSVHEMHEDRYILSSETLNLKWYNKKNIILFTAG